MAFRRSPVRSRSGPPNFHFRSGFPASSRKAARYAGSNTPRQVLALGGLVAGTAVSAQNTPAATGTDVYHVHFGKSGTRAGRSPGEVAHGCGQDRVHARALP